MRFPRFSTDRVPTADNGDVPNRAALKRQLTDLLAQEDQFVAVLTAMPTAMKWWALVGGRHPGAFAEKLAATAMQNDQPRALLAVRSELGTLMGIGVGHAGVEALRSLRSELSGLLGPYGRRVDATLSAPQISHLVNRRLSEHFFSYYAHTERRPKLALAMLERGHLTAGRFLQVVRHIPEQLSHALSLGLVTLNDVATEAPVRLDELRGWLETDCIDPSTFAEFSATVPGGLAAAEALTFAGILSPATFREFFEAPEDLTYRWLTANLQTPRDFFFHHPRPTDVHLSMLLEADLVTSKAWVKTGCMPIHLIVAAVDAGTLTTADFPDDLAIPTEIADRWLRENKLTANRHAHNEVCRWTPEMPLPPQQLRLVSAMENVECVLNTASLPPATAQAARFSYTLRLVSAFIHTPAPAAPSLEMVTTFLWDRFWPLQGLLHLPIINWLTLPFMQTSLAVGPPASPTEPCAVCFEPLTQPAVKLDGCQHPATFCNDCFTESLRQAADTGICPDVDCQEIVTAEDARKAGLTSSQVDEFARKLVRRWVAQRPDWAACPTPSCCGGATVAIGQTKQFDCRPCGNTIELKNTEDITDLNRPQVRLLIDGLREKPSSDRLSITREAWCCGAPTQLFTGCLSIQCTNCDSRWNFVDGASASHTFPGDIIVAQKYVPRGGLLMRCGFYAGLQPGSVVPQGVYAHVVARAAAMSFDVGDTPVKLPYRNMFLRAFTRNEG
jgi:hypothetical protein